MSEKAVENPEPSPFERMKALAGQVLSVSKSEVEKREKEWREAKAKKSAKQS